MTLLIILFYDTLYNRIIVTFNDIFKKILIFFIKYLTYTFKRVIIYTGGEGMAKKKSDKADTTNLITALINLITVLINLIALLLDRGR